MCSAGMSKLIEMEGNSLSKDLNVNMRHFRPPKHLFCDKEGNSVAFHVLESPDRDVILQLIKAGGGVIVDEGASENSGVITISSGALALGKKKDVISSSYIYVSCFYGALISLEEFRIILDCGDDGDKIAEEYCADELKTRMSAEEMHQLLVYLRKNECLWKEVEKNKVCGNWSGKSIQQDFTIWALKRFKEMESVCPESKCGSNLQEQSKAGCHEESLGSSSEVCSGAGSHIKSACEEIERECGVNEGRSRKARCSSSEKAQLQTSRIEEDMCDKSECDSEEEDISLNAVRKRVAGRLSVVIDDASMSEEEENTSCALEVKDNRVSESDKGWDEGVVDNSSSAVRKGVESLPLAVDEGNASKEQENVSCALEVNDERVSENDKGQDKDCAVDTQHDKTVMRKVKMGGVFGRNHSVPCNQWLCKDDAWGNMGVVATSTPACSRSDEGERDVSEARREDGAGSKNGQRAKPAVATTCRQTIPFHQRLYSYNDDMQILRWLCCKRKRCSDSLKGNRIWQFMESKSVLPGRSWQSLRERFRRHIAPNLNSYQIPPEEKKKLLRQIR